jgi:hypothetical protein
METLELISFDENGQGVVNWESLELLTSAEFVKAVKSVLIPNEYCNGAVSVIKEIDVDYRKVTVYALFEQTTLDVFTFYRGVGSFDHDVVRFHHVMKYLEHGGAVHVYAKQ